MFFSDEYQGIRRQAARSPVPIFAAIVAEAWNIHAAGELMPASSPQTCMSAFIDSMVRRDMNAALALLTDDVALFYSNGSALWGKPAFAAAMTANWKLVDGYSYKTIDLKWLTQSDTAAAVIYTFSWSGIAGGTPVSGGGRGTRVFRRTRKGFFRAGSGWRIAHEHLSSGDWKPSNQDTTGAPP